MPHSQIAAQTNLIAYEDRSTEPNSGPWGYHVLRCVVAPV